MNLLYIFTLAFVLKTERAFSQETSHPTEYWSPDQECPYPSQTSTPGSAGTLYDCSYYGPPQYYHIGSNSFILKACICPRGGYYCLPETGAIMDQSSGNRTGTCRPFVCDDRYGDSICTSTGWRGGAQAACECPVGKNCIDGKTPFCGDYYEQYLIIIIAVPLSVVVAVAIFAYFFRRYLKRKVRVLVAEAESHQAAAVQNGMMQAMNLATQGNLQFQNFQNNYYENINNQSNGNSGHSFPHSQPNTNQFTYPSSDAPNFYTPTAPTPFGNTPNGSTNMAQQIAELSKLRDQGILSESEFLKAKSKVLSS